MKLNKKFGICVIIASLFSGCSTTAPIVDPNYMTLDQLNTFVPNCGIRDQQMAVLTRQYTRDRDELAFSWRGVSGEARIANQIIMRHLIYLRDYC